MRESAIRSKLLEEIAEIPEDRLLDIYNLIHYFRLGLQVKKINPKRIMQLAGSWNDMSQDDFDEFLGDIMARRKKAFSSRRNRETSID